MKVIFSHGKESGPWGSKISRLATIAEQMGYQVESIDYTDLQDPDERVKRLDQVLSQEQGEFLLVGSSMGGYVSLAAAETRRPKGMFLLAPALFMPGYIRQAFAGSAPIEIVHGWSDDVIPPEHSIRFAKAHNCALHLIAGDHRLNTSLAVVEVLFAQFLTLHDQPLQK